MDTPSKGSQASVGFKLTGTDRTKRVKEARDEAKKEVDEYRKSKDEEFKKFESEVRLILPKLCRISS